MHRSYQSINPSSSKILQKRWDESSYDIHRRKLQKAKAIVNNKPPQTYMHLHTKLKKIQTEEERLAAIERDNRLLLEKMSGIMRTRGRIDNNNDYDHKSLNKIKRQREMLRVTSENQQILKRISAREPHYKHQAWDDDWRKNQQFLENITRFPKDALTHQVDKGKRANKKNESANEESLSDTNKSNNEDDVAKQVDNNEPAKADKSVNDEEIGEAIVGDQDSNANQPQEASNKTKTPESPTKVEESPSIAGEAQFDGNVENSTAVNDDEKKAASPTAEELRPKSSTSAKSIKSAGSTKSVSSTKSAKSVSSVKSASSKSGRSSKSSQHD